MGKVKELRHVCTYNGKLCEARPGTPPMMVPEGGTDCPECEKREKAFMAKHEGWKERQREHIAKLEAGWIEKDKKGSGS
jgi:hypothetical protein